MKSPRCRCGHSIKSHKGYNKTLPLLWMILNLGPCRNTTCGCSDFHLEALGEA